MLKRTLCFSTPGTLRLHLRQMLWKGEDGRDATIPIEDIGIIILESPLITMSTALLQELSMEGVTVRHCASKENGLVHIKRIQKITPTVGMVSILSITDKQFEQVITLYGKKEKPPPPAPIQLELF